MGVKTKEQGVYVNISIDTDSKLAMIAKMLPLKEGRRWFKKDVIAMACERYVEEFFSYFDDCNGITEMMDKAKQIDLTSVKPDLNIRDNTPKENDSSEESNDLSEF